MKRFVALLMLAGGLLVAGGAGANPVTFNVLWTGAGSAQATGTITFSDASIFTAGGNCNSTLANCNITAMSITVSGASSGNGTFSASDFTRTFIQVDAPLNISTNMVGQTVGVNTWQAGGGGGANDFNFFCNFCGGTAPNGFSDFRFRTNGGSGDPLTLSSMVAQSPAPAAQAVPTLSEWTQMLLGLLVMTLLGWHFHKQRSY